jgi:4-amino-4-deoxy-L-arabinose transferase-like glycosyltransferase
MQKKTPETLKMKTETYIFAVFILSGMFLFDIQKIWASFLFVFSCSGIYLYYFKNIKHDKKNKIDSKILFFISIAFICLKFYKIFSFPNDFFGDESTYIVTPHIMLNKNAGLFDYNTRYGISLPYICTWLTAAAMKLTTYHLDLLRFIPVLFFCATAYGFWKLARLIKMPEAAAAFVFVYTLSEWAWKFSKLYLPNFYIPFFTVFFLVLFFSAVHKRSLISLAGAGLIFACGFFTYGVWIIMTPFVIYIAVEYRKELGNKRTAGFLLFVVSFAVAAFLIYLSRQHITETMAGRTVFTAGTGVLNIVTGSFINLYKFFLSTIDTDMSFISAPFFYAVEAMLLIFGLIYICLNIKIRENRVILSGFIISLSTVMFGASIAHPVRHGMAFTFTAIICAMGLRSAALNRKFLFLLVPVYVFYALSFMFVYYFVWGSNMAPTMLDRKIAAYINTNYGNNALYMNDTEPFGRYMSFLRTKSAYRDRHGTDFDYVIFTTPTLWRKSLQDAFPGIGVKYFFEDGANAALWTLPMNIHTESRQPFMDMAKNLSEVDSLMWKEDYDSALAVIKSKISASRDIYAVLQNTFLKVHESTVYVKKRDLQKLADCMMARAYPVLALPDDYYFGGVLFETNKQYRIAYNYYEQASKLAPEWATPKAKMQLMKYLEGK